MALSKEQLLLLNNLIYSLQDEQITSNHKYTTVGDWIRDSRFENLASGVDDGGLTTAEDWSKIVQAFKKDPQLMNLKILTMHKDTAKGGGGGKSMIFADETSKEAVVLFRGTSENEWRDNFIGGNLSDTVQQKNALKWYQDSYKEFGLDQYDVTVTGHSKGGNKSKYITIRDETVDRCVSFDGQGFSDKFMSAYQNEIAVRQSKIENHNVDYDYVNLLLNDIGTTTYYKGKDIGNGGGGFLENHCPESFMDWDPEGNFRMEACPEGQPSEMKALDEFLNNCLRSLSDDEKDRMLSMIHYIYDFSSSLSEKTQEQTWNDFKELMHDPDTADSLPYLLAYFIQYERANPEMAKQIRDVMNRFGMGDFCQYVDMVEQLLNHGVDLNVEIGPFKMTINISFDQILDVINGIATVAVAGNKFTDGWVLGKLSEWIRNKWGLDVNAKDLEQLIQMVDKANQDMDRIRIDDNGADIRVDPQRETSAPIGEESSASGGRHYFRVEPDRVRKAMTDINVIANELRIIAGSVRQTKEKINFSTGNTAAIMNAVTRTEADLERAEKKLNRFFKGLDGILSLYEKTEDRLLV